MTQLIRTVEIIFFIHILAVNTAFPQNGKLLDASSVTFTEEQIEYFENQLPTAQEVMAKIDIKNITYLSDGLKVKGYLVEPLSAESSPCVIFNRGGNREFGAISDTMAVLRLGSIASRGYIVVASQYRGNAGGEGREEFGGADVNDVLNLIPLLESLPQADASRIGMYGWSRGGMMTYIALAKTDKIRAAIIGAGVSDSFDAIKRRPQMEKYVYAELIPNWEDNRNNTLEARSAIRWPEKLNKNTPILLLHGSADWRVDPAQSLKRWLLRFMRQSTLFVLYSLKAVTTA